MHTPKGMYHSTGRGHRTRVHVCSEHSNRFHRSSRTESNRRQGALGASGGVKIPREYYIAKLRACFAAFAWPFLRIHTAAFHEQLLVSTGTTRRYTTVSDIPQTSTVKQRKAKGTHGQHSPLYQESAGQDQVLWLSNPNQSPLKS